MMPHVSRFREVLPAAADRKRGFSSTGRKTGRSGAPPSVVASDLKLSAAALLLNGEAGYAVFDGRAGACRGKASLCEPMRFAGTLGIASR